MHNKHTTKKAIVRNHIRSRLLARNLTVSSWAELHGYPIQTVHSLIRRHVAGDRKIKCSGRAKKILRQLGKEIGIDLLKDAI